MIFISYGKENLEQARRLYSELRYAGYSPWLDVENLVPGQRWEFAIRDAIYSSDFFIALLSNASTTRKSYAHVELSLALNQLDMFPDSSIYLIPVRLDECELPKQRLRELHWIDLFPDWSNGVKKILAALGNNGYLARENSPAKLFNRDDNSNPLAPFQVLELLMNENDSPPFGNRGTADFKYGMLSPVDVLDFIKFKKRDIIVSTQACSVPLKREITEGFWESEWNDSVTSPKPRVRDFLGKNRKYLNYIKFFQRENLNYTNRGSKHSNKGKASIRIISDWIHFEIQDETSQYVIRARWTDSGILAGRYLNCLHQYDTNPWIGYMLDDRNISGFWGFHDGYWNFRKL